VREQQTHCAQVGELARLRHPQAEREALRGTRGLFQQRHDGAGRNPVVGVREHRAVQADLREHLDWIQRELLRDFEVVRQRCSANHAFHRVGLERRASL
jgi:hypothetical protein